MPGFKTEEFVQTKFVPREKSIPVPDLKSWFEEGQKPLWIVRGLDGYELARSRESVERNRDMIAIAEAFISGDKTDLSDAVKERLGNGEAIPDHAAEKIEMLVLGSVDPAVDNQLAVKLCINFPANFTQLTNEILRLTGQGACLGKQQDSGETQK